VFQSHVLCRKQTRQASYSKPNKKLSASTIHAKTGLQLVAKAIDITGSVLATEGVLGLTAAQDITLQPGQHHVTLNTATQQTANTLISAETRTTQHASEASIALNSQLIGDKVQLTAGKDFQATGLQLAGQSCVDITAQGELTLKSSANSLDTHHTESHEKSGLISDGGVSLTLGAHTQGTQQNQKQIIHTGPHLHSQGSLTLYAGKKLAIEGGELHADKLQLSGSQVEIQEVMNTQENTARQQQRQSGLTLGVGGGVAAVGGQVKQAIQAADQAQSDALKQAKCLQALYTVGSVASANPSRNQGISHKDLVKSLATGRLTEALKASGLEAQLSLGEQKTTHTAHQHASQAQSSCLQAGKLQIQAREADVRLSGCQIHAKDIDLEAAEDIAVRPATHTRQATQGQQHSQVKIGVSVGVKGTQAFGEVSEGKQQHSQCSTIEEQSLLQADQTLRIQSGGNTLLQGVKASGKQVQAKSAGQLRLESTQDTTQEESQSSHFGLSIGIPVGAPGCASLNFSNQSQEMQAKAASVKERTVLQAGKGGFTLAVGEATHLVGAGIQSEASANQNRLSTEAVQCEQLENAADYQQAQTGIQLSTGLGVGRSVAQPGDFQLIVCQKLS
jgi:filamentous hemagglutinin